MPRRTPDAISGRGGRPGDSETEFEISILELKSDLREFHPKSRFRIPFQRRLGDPPWPEIVSGVRQGMPLNLPEPYLSSPNNFWIFENCWIFRVLRLVILLAK